MFLLHKKLSSCLLPSHSLSSTHQPHHLGILRRLSTLTTQSPPPKLPFMAEYLITSCGFPSDKAIEASKCLTRVKSPSKPDSVLHFLRQCGWSDTHIINLISKDPNLLCANVEKNLKPKLRALQEMGFSQSQLIQLVSYLPNALRARDLRLKIGLLRSISVSNESLLKGIRRDPYLLSASFAKRIKPNISFLKECGISDCRIKKMIVSNPRFIRYKPDSIKAFVKRAEELGVSRGSGMFRPVLLLVSSLSRAKLDAKFNFLKGLGWSEADISATFRKVPSLLNLSDNNICNKMGFFTREAGCEPSFVACRPVLLLYSFERRLVPRYSVLSILKNEGLFNGNQGLVSAIKLPEKKFVERFVLPYQEKILGLREAYIAACAK